MSTANSDSYRNSQRKSETEIWQRDKGTVCPDYCKEKLQLLTYPEKGAISDSICKLILEIMLPSKIQGMCAGR